MTLTSVNLILSLLPQPKAPLIKTLPTSTINIHNIVQFLKASIPLMEVRYNAKNASKSVFSKTPIYFVFERETIGC